MEELIIKLVTELGSLGISAALLIYIWRRDKMLNTTMNNHIKHFTDSLDRLSEVIGGCKFNKLNKK